MAASRTPTSWWSRPAPGSPTTPTTPPAPSSSRSSPRSRAGRRGSRRPGRPLRRHPRVRHRRAAGRGRRRAQPDEPGRRDPGRGRAGRLPARTGRDRARRHRLRRPAPQRRLRPRHRRGDAPAPGIPVWLLPRPLPTPVLAFAIRELGCAAGVMVTASHNPPQDNGYKVYLGDGSQIVPPRTPRSRPGSPPSGRWPTCPRGTGAVLGEHVVDRYLDDVAELAADGPRDLDRLHAAARGRRHLGAPGPRDRRLRGAARGRAAGAARPRLPDRRLPQPGGARRDGPRAGAGRRARRRPGRRQRPRRRPLRGGGADARTAGGCCAATRSARCSRTT